MKAPAQDIKILVTVIKNSVGKDVLVNQVGCYGINLGKIDFYFDHQKNKVVETNTLQIS